MKRLKDVIMSEAQHSQASINAPAELEPIPNRYEARKLEYEQAILP
jgi:hypothetical protein